MTPLPKLWRALVHCPDPARSANGAWLFDGNQDFRSMIAGLKQEDPSRTIPACFELIGAVWDDSYFVRFEMPVGGGSHAYCPDASRPIEGAWFLDASIPIEDKVREFKFEDASRTTADCFQLLGAFWMADHFSAGWVDVNEEEPSRHAYFDPERTKIERIPLGYPNASGIEESRSGAWFIGAWWMTLKQKAVANRLKRENPELVWWQCSNRAGGKWGYCAQHVLDEDGRTAEEIIWETHTNPLVV